MHPALLRRAALALALFAPGALVAQSRVQLAVTGMPADAPLEVAAALDDQGLRVDVALRAGWHLYGRDVGGGQPVAIAVAAGAFTPAGPLETPTDDAGLITGAATLRLPLRRTGEGAALTATMRFMVCDALECLPPIELMLRTPQGPSVLLVGVDAGERTQRIAAFLRERGMTVDVTTYADVTAARCDAHDVVLADSPTFHHARGAIAQARAFPATASPVVAVGFLGTELLEAHRVAMACGYI